ncbi:MAG: hypothetical protein ACREVW_03385, partial [Burkholderiales bacterium]
GLKPAVMPLPPCRGLNAIIDNLCQVHTSRQDAESILGRLIPVRRYLTLLGGALWHANSESDRAALRRMLSVEPAIQRWLDDQNKIRRQKREEALQQKLPQRRKRPATTAAAVHCRHRAKR